MLNRRILRIKAFKVIYSYLENPSMTLKEAEAELRISCEAVRDLYLYILALSAPLTMEARARIEAARGKFNPTEEEKNPNFKFAGNAVARLLAEDPDFCKILLRRKLSWEQNDAFVRDLYNTIRERDYFAEYMASEQSSIKEDAALWVKIFANELPDDPALAEILEDMSIYWNDDLEYAINACCTTLDEIGKGRPWNMPELYMSDMRKDDPGVQSDMAFVTKLLRSAFNGCARYKEMIAEAVPQWDGGRLFNTDVALIVCGLAEAENFSEIPPKVSLNEYVEISKSYGAPKSRRFVNGLLDSLIKNKLSLSL